MVWCSTCLRVGELANEHPYRKWLSTNCIQLEKLKSGRKVDNSVDNLIEHEILFGYGKEDIDDTIVPMCVNSQELTAAMGNDTPLAVLSGKPQVFFNYFRQQFAQVTNPAIDSIRENLVMSLTEYIGRVGSGILSPDESNCKMVRLPHPILTNTQLDILCNIRYKGFNTVKLPILFECSKGEDGLRDALDKLCKDAEKSVDEEYNYIILSDREVDKEHAAIPSLLAVSAVHHYLISVGKRVQTALIVESGEIRETMHAALLLGYGASALCPYMTFAILDDLVKRGKIQENYATAEANYIKAVKKALLKIMAKMGISTIRSYRGAKIFESIGLSESLLKTYFGTDISTIGGIGLETIAHDAIALHDKAFSMKREPDFLPNLGQFHYRKDGIKHAWNPETIATLQLATRTGNYKKYKEYTKLVDEKEDAIFIRDFFDFKRKPISIDKVEPVESIVKHFVTGAMSFGALSIEAHEAIALAMNKIGARSNTGEGGEDNERFHSTVDGISLSSKTKQIASGRFGVTTEYLVNAEELQIKVAQGAKPGEGGQLPGFKVNEIIAGMGACTDSAYAKSFQIPGTFAPIADYDVLSACVETGREMGLAIKVGNILSSDVFYKDEPYAEGSCLTNRERWAKMGVLAEEMEAAALYMNAARCGKRALAVCTISDHILRHEYCTAEERQNSFTQMMELALKTAVKMEK